MYNVEEGAAEGDSVYVICPTAVKGEGDLGRWLGAFGCPEENVAKVVGKIRRNPLIPKDVPIHGLIFCPTDGHLEVIIRGY